MERLNVSTETSWEELVGYSRVVRKGTHVYVSGTTATDENGQVIGIGDAYRQTVQIINNIDQALRKVNATLEDVVRTRIYVIDIDEWESVGRAHGMFFSDIRPATSMVEVSRLIDPDMLVEIEAVALLS